MSKKPDKRTLKTKKALQDTLAVLLSRKVLRKITVQEVADAADVNRVTFYKHYLDIFDLYEQMEKEILSDLGLLILDYKQKEKTDFSTALIDHIQSNPNIFKMMFSPYNTGELRDKFCKMIEGLFRLMQAEKNHTNFSDSRMDYYAAYQSKAFIAILEKWVLEDLNRPKEFIIKTIAEFDTHTELLIAAQYDAE